MSGSRAKLKTFYDHRFQRKSVVLLPGDYYVTGDSGETIVTLLGSCVAACIRDTRLGIGGMNHFMLPREKKRMELSSANVKDWMFEYDNKSARYGSVAMEFLINEIIKRGGQRRNLEAMIFGGGKIGEEISLEVGKNNVTFVKEYLAIEGIPIKAQDTDNTWPLKVYYMPDNGEVYVKRVKSEDKAEIVQREKLYSTELSHREIQGGIYYLD